MAGVAGTLGKSIFFKLAGVSGVLGVALGAYGAHGPSLNKPGAEKFKEVFKTANLYHLVHTVALLAAPLAQRPNLVGGLIFTGMTLFSGSCYVVALSQNRKLGILAPFGGTLLMIGWASFLF
ncbi:transmembrane protein 256 homolog [Actinia tenebrosa]|uniref:Transmembrane protein 256 homolog n=1 Tax=Actinia tenebrosa TaxID=6105 RepID=A0A6P8INQ7_ACTTE|nr:transmembrane protein 256 homolog [Actinia tenebrosa]